MEPEAIVLHSGGMHLLPGNLFLEHRVHLCLHLRHVGIRSQSDIGTIAVVAHQIGGSVVGECANRRHRHHNIKQTEGAVLVERLKHAANGHRPVRSGYIAKGLAHHVASKPLVEPTADQALPRRAQYLPGIALQDACTEDVEETGVNKDGMVEREALTVFEHEFLVDELVGVARANHYFGDVAAQRRNGSARCVFEFGSILSLLLETLRHGIYVLPVHDAAVVVALQLHLGNQHQPDRQSNGQRENLDEGPLTSM